MTDQEIIKGLIDRDNKITQQFFFQNCRPILYGLIDKYFPQEKDYDAYVGEIYLHLIDKDAKRLKQFKGQSSLVFWLQIVIENYFLDKIKRSKKIETAPDDSLLRKAKDKLTDISADEAKMDVCAILDYIDNESYRVVIQKHLIEGMDFDELAKITGKSKDNLYNIKCRAIKALKKVARIASSHGDALCAVYCEQFILHCFGIHKSISELKEIATSRGWLNEEGALVDCLGNTALHYGLHADKFTSATLQDIIESMAAGGQVLAAVDGGELIGDPVDESLEDVLGGGIVDHCVVILSIDKDEDKIALYDPAFGVVPLTVTIPHFLEAWADSRNYCVMVSK
ncbi:MAG: sigma-70 family RNA polymerase sigma factor [Bacteroidales bacterium]|nr:sigma-70 family RNA polymerase sigma factor [Bacteroidales bacterium]